MANTDTFSYREILLQWQRAAAASGFNSLYSRSNVLSQNGSSTSVADFRAHTPHSSSPHRGKCGKKTVYFTTLSAAHLNHWTRKVYEMPANEQAGKSNREGRAQTGNDQDGILCFLEHCEPAPPPGGIVIGGNNLFPEISSPRRKKQLINERKHDAFTVAAGEPGAGAGERALIKRNKRDAPQSRFFASGAPPVPPPIPFPRDQLELHESCCFALQKLGFLSRAFLPAFLVA